MTRNAFWLGIFLVFTCKSWAIGGVCTTLKNISENTPLSFEQNKITGLCHVFNIKKQRKDLDRCGSEKSDPYSSPFTWASRETMEQSGKIHLWTHPDGEKLQKELMQRAVEVKNEMAAFCCGKDEACHEAMGSVPVTLCKSKAGKNQPDPCVFGGSYQFTASEYRQVFRSLWQDLKGAPRGALSVLQRNLSAEDMHMKKSEVQSTVLPGKIVLSSYININHGIATLEPVLRHELGHACSMIKSQINARRISAEPEKAMRALQWLDHSRDRCEPGLKAPQAYYDFWESLGESPSLAKCFYHLAQLNQDQKIDRPCRNICASQVLEESVGIAFSLLTGELKGQPEAAFPNTCNHVRDGQHPMVADVVECLSRYSPRFRERMSAAYRCQ